MCNLINEKIFQIVILLLSLLSSTLAQAKFDLPPLETDAKKLSFLLQVREQIPKLFADAAAYDIDLFDLLDNEAKLVELLQKNHVNFDQLYAEKKYIKMTIQPTADIWIGQIEIDPKAIGDWKNSLHQKIKDTEELVRFDDLVVDTQKMLDLDPVQLLNKFGMVDKKNKELLNKFRDKNKKLLECKKQANVYEKFRCIFNSYESLSGLPNLVPKKEINRIMKAILEEERILPLLHLAIIKEYKHPQNWQSLTDVVDTLRSEDLLFLSDKKDGLKPILLTFFNNDESDARFKLTLERIHKELEGLSKKTTSRATKITKGIELLEVPPTVGIFRGCVGGDCSSRYSFPYPNDPHERVFLIKKLKSGLKENNNHQLKGYVSTTEIIVDGEPALYVVTISGVNVSAADTELIFRGLDEAKEKLGVKLIVLPESKKLGELINFPAIRGVYEKHLHKNSSRISIQYQNQDIRNEIQNYQPSSKYNSASYDHMANNMNGAVLSFNSDKNVSITIKRIKQARNNSPSLNQENVFDFIYELNKSNGKNAIKRILQIDEVVKIFGDGSAEKIENFFQLIGADGTSKRQRMKVSEFRNYVITTIKKLNFDLSYSYIEKFSKLMHGGYLLCEDIFSEDNMEKTADFLGRIASVDDNFYVTMAREHRVKIFNTKKFAKYKTLFYENLDAIYFEDFSKGIKFFKYAETIDEKTFQKLISIITNSQLDLRFRKAAIEAFHTIPPNDYGMLMNSLVSCLKEGNQIGYPAAELLLKIGQQDDMFTKNLISLLNDGPKSGLNEFLLVLRVLALNNPHFAHEVANNPMVVKIFTECLNDVSGQELIKILGMMRVVAVNNPALIGCFFDHLKRAQKMKKYAEIGGIVEAIIGDSVHDSSEIENNPVLIEVFINCLNDAQGKEFVGILRALRAVITNNSHVAKKIANNSLFVKAFINRLHHALGCELIEITGMLKIPAFRQIAGEVIEVLINRLENAHSHETEIISRLEELADDYFICDHFMNNILFTEALIRCLNSRSKDIRSRVIGIITYTMPKDSKSIDYLMVYVRQHVYSDVSETAKLLFGDDYRKFFARSADCNLL